MYDVELYEREMVAQGPQQWQPRSLYMTTDQCQELQRASSL